VNLDQRLTLVNNQRSKILINQIDYKNITKNLIGEIGNLPDLDSFDLENGLFWSW